jgi:hypothetical protein
LNENGAPDPPRTELLPRNEKDRKNSKNSGSLDPPPPQVGAKNHKKSVSEHPECNVVDQRFTFDVIFDGSGFVAIFGRSEDQKNIDFRLVEPLKSDNSTVFLVVFQFLM